MMLADVPQSTLLVSRCRLRVFLNGKVGRAIDWALLITELPQAPEESAYLRHANPCAPARHHLDELATEIKRVHFPRTSPENIAWFYHQPAVAEAGRPMPHHEIKRVIFSLRRCGGKDVYFGHCRVPASPQDLEIAAGGLVDL